VTQVMSSVTLLNKLNYRNRVGQRIAFGYVCEHTEKLFDNRSIHCTPNVTRTISLIPRLIPLPDPYSRVGQ